jgi:hypothetical protein
VCILWSPLVGITLSIDDYVMKWCNTHERPAELCKTGRGGIMLPCRVVDLTDILEIEYIEEPDDDNECKLT